jgi:hypothetical protein
MKNNKNTQDFKFMKLSYSMFTCKNSLKYFLYFKVCNKSPYTVDAATKELSRNSKKLNEIFIRNSLFWDFYCSSYQQDAEAPVEASYQSNTLKQAVN